MSQDQPIQRNCGAMIEHRRLLNEDPSYAAARAAIETLARAYELGVRGSARVGITRIPVVVHVVWNTNAQNISDAQIQSQIDVLNQDYRMTNTDIGQVPAVWQPLRGDARIEFFLATTDPNGNPTNGITRTQTMATSFPQAGNPIKFAATGGANAWPTDRYLNIWIAPRIPSPIGDLLGYAQFPGGPANTDGVVILHSAFGTNGTAAAPYDRGRTATHEIGHWLNLFHIWGDDGTGCGGSDEVADTPNAAGPNFGCPSFPSVTCSNGPNGDMFMNYMDYTNDACMFMFTAGQVTRMQAALDGPRASIGATAQVPTVVVSGGPFTYDCNPHHATAQAQGAGGVPVAGTFTFTYNGSSTPPVNAGTYAVVATFTSNDPNYTNATGIGTLTINRATPTVVVSSGPFTYDCSPHPASAVAQGCAGHVAGTFTFTYNGSSSPPVNAGTYAVVATFTSNNSNYTNATGSGTLTINPATPTVVVSGGPFTYDGYPHVATAGAHGCDGPVVGTFTFTYNGSSTPPVNAGTYAVVATFTTNNPNYTNATGTGSLTINRQMPTITWADPADIDHGTALDATQLNASASGVVRGNTVAVPGRFTYDPPAGTVLDCGIHQPLTVGFVPDDAINFLPATKTVRINVRGDKNCWTRIDLEVGKDRITGSRAGRYDIREVLTGRLLAKWYPVIGDTDSGCFSTLRISFDSVWVNVIFYPDGGGAPILMKVLNPADEAGHGWIARGGSEQECAAIEVEYP